MIFATEGSSSMLALKKASLQSGDVAAASGFRRNASTASVASVHQSFLETEPAHPKTNSTAAVENKSPSIAAATRPAKASAGVAVGAASPLPVPPPIPQLRALHGRVRSDVQQAFFDSDDGRLNASRLDTARAGGLPAATSATRFDFEKCDEMKDVAATPSPAPPLPEVDQQNAVHGLRQLTTEKDPALGERNDAGIGHSRGDGGGYQSTESFEALRAFPQQYEHSDNPYLRAAAREVASSTFSTSYSNNDPVVSADVSETAAQLFDYRVEKKWSVEDQRRNAHGPLSSAAGRKTPQLSQPSSAFVTRQDNRPPTKVQSFPGNQRGFFSPMECTSTVHQLRGIPLFPHTRKRAGSAASASPPSMQQSLALYGQLQLQDEAVHWYHRSNALELQLAELQAAHKRQSELLAAQWRRAETKPPVRASQTGASSSAEAGGEKIHLDSTQEQQAPRNPSPASQRGEGAAAGAAVGDSRGAASRSAESSRGRGTALTSRSPDSLSRPYLDEDAESASEVRGGSAETILGETSSPDPLNSVPRGSDNEAVLGAVTEATMHYVVAKPRPEELETVKSAQEKDTLIKSASSVAPALIQRGEARLAVQPDTLHQAHTDAEKVPQRGEVGVQTDAAQNFANSAAFTREGSEAASHSPRVPSPSASVTVTAPAAQVSSPPAPSAILAKQFAEAVEEVASMQVRLDVAQREAENWREMCITQELRCDDLETQLLAKEEQLAHYTRPEQPPRAAEKEEQKESGAAELIDSVADPPSAVTSTIELSQAVGQLTELLRDLNRLQGDDNTMEKSVELVQGDHAPHGQQQPMLQLARKASASTSSSSSASDGNTFEGNTGQLRQLIDQFSEGLRRFAQQHAAVKAELEVVRADRNELIGEQSEQVRTLQEQLLEKDKEQLRLMDRLHSARQRAASPRLETSPSTQMLALTERHPESTATTKDEKTSEAAEESTRQRSALERDNCALANEVASLQAQLAEARAASSAAQEAQRAVFTERMEVAQSELKNVRLAAEDEYDHLSSTIESLTRELADTKEALRVKEVSLRIALRESAPAALLAKSSPWASDSPFHDVSRFSEPAVWRDKNAVPSPSLSGDAQRSPSERLQLLLDRSHASAASVISPPVATPEASVTPGSLDTSPSPPVPSPDPPSPTRRLSVDMSEEKLDSGSSTDSFNERKDSPIHNDKSNFLFQQELQGPSGRAMRSSVSSSSPLPQRGRAFVDDGTLRTLHSSLPLDAEDDAGGDHNARARMIEEKETAAQTAFLSTSREKSSRGLTTSTAAGSHTASSSLPRGQHGSSRSSGSTHSHSADEHATRNETHLNRGSVESAFEQTVNALDVAEPQEGKTAMPLNSLPLSTEVEGEALTRNSGLRSEGRLHEDEGRSFVPAQTAASQQNLSERRADARGEVEKAQSASLPLRESNFNSRLSSTQFYGEDAAASTRAAAEYRRSPSSPSPSPSPLTQARTPLGQLPANTTERNASVATSHSPSFSRGGSGGRQTSRLPSTATSLSPEQRLQHFLNSTASAFEIRSAADYDGVTVAASGEARHPRWLTAQAAPMSETEKKETQHLKRVHQTNNGVTVSPQRGGVEGDFTPARNSISLLSERTPLHASSASAASTPSSGFGGSPQVSEVAARHTQASLRRHREVWQQQESLLQSLLSTPSP